jgi:hypothetical protein
MSELTLRPDRSDNALQLYDRLEINGDALRRETGFDEGDKPTADELKEQGLKIIIKTLPSGAGSALSELTGEPVTIQPVAAAPPGEAPPEDAQQEEERTPPEPSEPPPVTAADQAAAVRARDERMARQVQAPHAVRFIVGRTPELLHPPLCAQHAYSCPFTHAQRRAAGSARPGASGVYEARLDAFGQFRVGAELPHLDTSQFVTTISGPVGRANGFAHSSI